MNAKNVFLVVSKDFYTDLLILCMTYWMALLFCTQIFPIYKYVFLKLFCLFNALSATGRSSTHIAMPKLNIKTYKAYNSLKITSGNFIQFQS